MLEGEVDQAAIREFEVAIDAAISAACIANSPAVAIDLSHVTFMDSAGLNGLIAAMHMAATHDRKLVLRNPPTQVRNLFEMAGVGDLFEIIDSPGARRACRDAGDRTEGPGSSTTTSA